MDKLFEELGIEQEVKTLEELELVNNFVLIENRILNKMLEEKDEIIRSLEIQLNTLIQLNEEKDVCDDYEDYQPSQECHQDDDENENPQDDEPIPQNIKDFLEYIQEILGDSIEETPLPVLKHYIKSVAPIFGFDANSVDISMMRGV